MIKVVLKDLYDGLASVGINFSESPGKLYEVLQDFLDISGDQVGDESAYLVARRLHTYLKRIGYPVELNSQSPAVMVFKIDLPSGSISPAAEIGNEINLPESEVSEMKPSQVSENLLEPSTQEIGGIQNG